MKSNWKGRSLVLKATERPRAHWEEAFAKGENTDFDVEHQEWTTFTIILMRKSGSGSSSTHVFGRFLSLEKLIADGRQSFTFAAWTDRYHCPC